MRAAFLWHFHQPLYRHPITGEFVLPWVRLHGTRSYYDMPRVLLEFEHVRANFNLVPSLVVQLDAYVNGQAKDRFLELTRRSPGDLRWDDRVFLVRNFFMVDFDTGIRPSPRYSDLFRRRNQNASPGALERTARAFDDQALRDLQVHFNLAWFGFKAREEFPLLGELAKKDSGFTEDDKAALLATQQKVLSGVLPGFADAFKTGRAELSVTPFYHPILPLVIDTESARRCMPNAPLPPRFAWPEDARLQVTRALDFAEQRLGQRPCGMWPAEGSVSPEAAGVMAQAGVRWFATDEGVLLRSLPGGTNREQAIGQAWTVEAEGTEIAAVFREQRLSDKIGFTYSRQEAGAAAADLVDGIARAVPEGDHAVVLVALDGENPWERFPNSGGDFLRTLYRRFEQRDRVETVTLRDHLATHPPRHRIRTLHTGSWIEANFRVWIGHPEDVAGWTLLGAARSRFEEKRSQLSDQAQRDCLEALWAAEGSDWFWWYGDDFATETAAEFDALFRGHVEAAWRAMGEPVPPAVDRPISRAAAGLLSVAEPATAFIQPVIDGRVSSYFEWTGSALFQPQPGAGSMYRGVGLFASLRWGFSRNALYLRLDPAGEPASLLGAADELRVQLSGARVADVRLALAAGTLVPVAGDRAVCDAVFRDIVEAKLPFDILGVQSGVSLGLAVQVLAAGVLVDRLPRAGEIALVVPGEDFERVMWKA